MRTKLRSKVTLLFMSLGLLLAIPAIAFADDIRDGLEDGAQETQTITAGDSTSTGFTNQYWIVANAAGTSPTGCDVLAEGDSITATFNVNTPTGVTASVSSLTFDECRAGSDLNSQTVKFTSNTPGTYTIPALTKDSGTGTYTTTNTDFTLVVNDNCPGGDTSGNLQDGKCTANTAPIAVVDSYTVNEGGTLNVPAPGVLGNDTDAENNSLTATLVGTGPSHDSSFTFNSDGSFVYTHDGSETTSDSFTYKAKDSNNAEGNTVTVTITIVPVDDPPTAVNDSATVQEDAAATAIDVLANDTDIDAGPKTISAASDPAKGTVVLTGGTSGEHTGLTYEPDPNYCGSDSFTYKLNGNSEATVAMTVTCVNDAPSQPGTISSTESLNNDGTFDLNWGDSTDVDSANITYTLEHRDFAATSDWSEVASGLTTSDYTFGGTNAEDEGLWDYRVKAVDDYAPPASSDYREALDLVKVDQTNPNAPTLSFATGAGQSPKVTVGSVDWYTDSALINVADTGDPVNASDGSTGSGVDANSFDASFTVSTNGTSTHSKTVKDNATNESADSDALTVNVDAANPTLGNCPTAGPFLVNSGSGTPTTQSVGPITANDGESGIDGANSQLTKSVNTTSTGTKTVTFTAKDKVGHSVTKNCDYVVNAHTFIGFSSPVDNPSYLNVLKAGQAVPLKWQLKDASGNPVTNLQSVSVTVKDLNCSTPTNIDLMEEVAAGASSLQNLGGGYYQFNWKSPTSYAKSCKMLTVNGEGVQQSAYFQFNK